MTTVTRNRMPIPEYNIFVEGEEVMLKSGGPLMTVIGYCDECDAIECAYGDSDGDVSIIELPGACIVRVH